MSKTGHCKFGSLCQFIHIEQKETGDTEAEQIKKRKANRKQRPLQFETKDHHTHEEPGDTDTSLSEEKDLPMDIPFRGYEDVWNIDTKYNGLALSPSTEYNNGKGDILGSFDNLPKTTCPFEEVIPSTSKRYEPDKVKHNEDRPSHEELTPSPSYETTTPIAACKNVRFYRKVTVEAVDKNSFRDEDLQKTRSAIANNRPDSFNVMGTPMECGGRLGWNS